MKHIAAIHDEGKSWCGQALEDPYFKSVDAVVLSRIFPENSTPACSECLRTIIERITNEQ